MRNYKPDPVPDLVIHRILQAGRWSPTSSNTQAWHFIVIRDRDSLAALGTVATQGPFLPQAAFVIAVVMDNAPRPQLDAGRAIQQMEIMAWSEGVGMCFAGVRAEEQQREIKRMLNIPAEMELITLLGFGYRAEGDRGRGTPRKPMSEIAHSEKFGQSYTTA